MMKLSILGTMVLATLLANNGTPRQKDPTEIEAIASFLAGGLGERHAEAPGETDQFGQLVGLWKARQEMSAGDGNWNVIGGGYWAWKYALDGFAVQDLWYQGSNALPPYLSGFGRDYLLSTMRLFDVQSRRWQVSWMSNGAGKSPGSDFGTFEAVHAEGQIVMTSPPDPRFGQQRVVFSEITEDTFTWVSEYSRDDGHTWTAMMRMKMDRVL